MIFLIILSVLILCGIGILLYRTQSTHEVIMDDKDEVNGIMLERMINMEKMLNEVLVKYGKDSNDLQNKLDKVFDKMSSIGDIMRSGSARGKWGEFILENIVKSYGFIKQRYKTQDRIYVDNRYYSPDLTIYLPYEKVVYIDSKFPLEAYMKDDKDFVQALRSEIKKVGEYSKLPNSIGFSILFIPAEGIYNRIIDVLDAELLNYLVKNNVILASPITVQYILYLLNSVLGNFIIKNNISEVADRVNEAMEKMINLNSKLDNDIIVKLKSLYGAIMDYRKEVDSLGLKIMEVKDEKRI